MLPLPCQGIMQSITELFYVIISLIYGRPLYKWTSMIWTWDRVWDNFEIKVRSCTEAMSLCGACHNFVTNDITLSVVLKVLKLLCHSISLF